MKKQRSPNRENAFLIYKEHHANITYKEIAEMLNEKIRNIKYWKKEDKWDEKYNPKGGAPIGNKNAIGNSGGAPEGNQNARTEGWYSKYYPIQVRNLVKEAEESGSSPLDILWAQIVTQWVAIVRAQEIMFVKDHDDKTKELKKIKKQFDLKGPKGEKQVIETYSEEEYEIQQAWDKHANFLNAQSRAMSTLTNMIKRYDEMLLQNRELVTEEQRLRVEKLKIQIQNPEFEHEKNIDKEKIQLEREKFEYQKKVGDTKVW